MAKEKKNQLPEHGPIGEGVDPLTAGKKTYGENVQKKSEVRSKATTSNSRDRLERAEAQRRAAEEAEKAPKKAVKKDAPKPKADKTIEPVKPTEEPENENVPENENSDTTVAEDSQTEGDSAQPEPTTDSEGSDK